MADRPTVVSDLAGSTARISRYWIALRQGAFKRLGRSPLKDAPARSYIYPHVVYEQGPREAFYQLELPRWFELERAEFSGMPMGDPKRFLDRLQATPRERFTYESGRIKRTIPRQKLSAALSLVAEAWPQAAGELEAASIGISWIESRKGRVDSTSDPKRFGVIHLNAEYFENADAYELATALVHETAHHALYVETSIDPLIPEDFKTLVYSPLRREMRPAIAVLHAGLSIARMGQWALRLQTLPASEGRDRELRRIRADYVSGLPGILKGLKVVRMSPHGTQICGEMDGLASAFEALPA